MFAPDPSDKASDRASSGKKTSAGGKKTAAGAASSAQSSGPAWLSRLESPLAAYYLILGATVALAVLGLVMVLSSSSVYSLTQTRTSTSLGNPYGVFTKQAMFAAIGLPLAWVAAVLPVRAWKVLAWPAMVATAALLALVAVKGSAVNGNQNWIALGPFTIQPSEGAKLALVIWAATVLSSKAALLGRLPHVIVPVVPGAVLLMALVMLGNDLGTTLVLLALTAAVLWVAGASIKVFLLGLAVGVPAVVGLVRISPNRLSRLGAWSGQTKCEYLDSCWQSTHGLWGLATGGWWGVGLGASREKWSWLPEAHNDFIFAIIGEELGLAGTLVVLALFALLGIGLFRLVLASDELFVKIATGGVLAWVVGQALVNIGAVLGLFPIIGVPLPLVSTGGSALITTLAALGMVLGFARRVPGAPEALVAREGLVRRSFAVLPRRTERSRASRRPGQSRTPVRRGAAVRR
jgi:cell division protein FtsW